LQAATVDVAAVEAQLDRDHYGLGKVRKAGGREGGEGIGQLKIITGEATH